MRSSAWDALILPIMPAVLNHPSSVRHGVTHTYGSRREDLKVIVTGPWTYDSCLILPLTYRIWLARVSIPTGWNTETSSCLWSIIHEDLLRCQHPRMHCHELRDVFELIQTRLRRKVFSCLCFNVVLQSHCPRVKTVTHFLHEVLRDTRVVVWDLRENSDLN